MSKGDILVTDSLFIFDEHVRQIEDSGYSVVRLDKPAATEEELCEAIKGKVGYILGGVEKVTDKVISSSDQLKVIAFTGAGYTEFIPGYDTAKKKGIAITAAKGGNAAAVAELALTFSLMGVRAIPKLTTEGGASFLTTKSATESVIGVIGYGAIGQKLAELAKNVGFSVLVHSRTEPKTLPSSMRFVGLEDLVRESDVISLHVDKINGEEVLKKKHISIMKNDAVLVNVAFEEAVDLAPVLDAVNSEKITYFADHSIASNSVTKRENCVATNSQTGFNTHAALRRVSNQTTKSLLSVLETGTDDFRVI